MKYMTCSQIAQKWNISDRRVRILCREGRIEGAVYEKGKYLIPENAKKPSDNRYRKGVVYEIEGEEIQMVRESSDLLKWGNDTIGRINSDRSVDFFLPRFNETVSIYTKGRSHWSAGEFADFLSGRIISPQRRDIEKMLYRLGLSSYDVFKVAIKTRAINSSDLLWIALDENERMEDAVTEVFASVFSKGLDLEGDSVDTPEGANIKRYGVYNGQYGIYKRRINPLSKDVESELAVYRLACLLGIPCCPVYRTGEDEIFSQFMYKVPEEHIVHFRRFFETEESGLANVGTLMRGANEYHNLISARPQYQAQIIKMIALDHLTRQDDRHLSNIAVKISSKGEEFYPLYDNGRSLFYEDSEETVRKAVADIKGFSTAFGPSGTYYDCIEEIRSLGVDFRKLLDLDIKESSVKDILLSSGFRDYRLDGSLEWIMKAAEHLRGC